LRISTGTATVTATTTATATGTATATVTTSTIVTNTSTGTGSGTTTRSNTVTNTQVVTNTSTITTINTIITTSTVTNSGTMTQTVTVTQVQTDTTTATVTNTDTVTHTNTSTLTVTNTTTATITNTATDTLTDTDTSLDGGAGYDAGVALDAAGSEASLDTQSAEMDSGDDLPPAPAASSVAYQVDPAHTGNQPSSSLTTPLTRQWTVDLVGKVSYPLVADGRVFVTVAKVDSQGTRLHALDLQTGMPVWGPIDIAGDYSWSNAAYDYGKVYVVNFNGMLTAFDASTGNTLWAKQLPRQYAFTSPPTATRGMVFVSGAGIGGTVYGVDGADGSVLWTASVENGDSSSPAVSATGVYVSYVCAQIYDFAPLTGISLWHHSSGCEGGGGKTPVLYGGQLWTRDWATSNLVLDAATGAAAGSFPASAIPAFAGARGFFLASGTLQARDVGTLSLLWTFSGDGTLASPPLVVNDTVYIGSSAGKLYALDAATGSAQWSDSLDWGISASDEQNDGQPLAGMGAGGDSLLVPAGSHLVCYR